jgi:hypothetical protein
MSAPNAEAAILKSNARELLIGMMQPTFENVRAPGDYRTRRDSCTARLRGADLASHVEPRVTRAIVYDASKTLTNSENLLRFTFTFVKSSIRRS